MASVQNIHGGNDGEDDYGDDGGDDGGVHDDDGDDGGAVEDDDWARSKWEAREEKNGPSLEHTTLNQLGIESKNTKMQDKILTGLSFFY